MSLAERELAALRAECAARRLGDVDTQLTAADAAANDDTAAQHVRDADDHRDEDDQDRGRRGKRARLALWFTPAPASKLAATPLPPGTPWTHHELAAARKLWQLELQRAAAGASSAASADDAHHLLALYTVLLPGRTAEELGALLGSSEFAAYRERLEQRGAAPQAVDASTPPATGTDQLADLAWGIRKLASARAHLDAVFGAPPGAPDHAPAAASGLDRAATASGLDRAATASGLDRAATASGLDRAGTAASGPDRAGTAVSGPDRAVTATAGDGGADASLAMLDAFADVYRKRSALDALLLGAAPPDAAAPSPSSL